MKEWHRFARSVSYAWAGILHTIRTQRNMQIHLTVTVLVLVAMWWLEIPRGDRLLVFFAIGLVLALETFNTAIEAAVDLVTTERHPLAKIAKDAGAGAVLIGVFTAVLIGLYVFVPPLWTLVNTM
ncbi:diacylglycerol kinase family protein [Brevibacillus migulae]|uniref:diacylglycerol kinase family protein n=1 Tax=Brevibacillus migulae TaxID=1644114 RepID=UPI00106EA0AA|nr:diacylglycerol kinase family protein [Brevibacillus migulae]